MISTEAKDAVTTKSNTVWYPLPGSQYAFITCPIPEILFEGTRGNGKTVCLLAKFAQHVGKGWGSAWRGVIFRKTYEQLFKNVIPRSKELFYRCFPKGDPSEASYNGSEHAWTWKTGETLFLRYYASKDDYENYHGDEYSFIGWEELVTWPTPDGYDDMKSCWRSPVPGIPKIYASTTNPYAGGGAGFNWVKQYFKIGEISEMEIIQDYDSLGNPNFRTRVHGEIWENPFLMQDQLYMSTLMSIKDPNKRKAWLEGRWDIVAGGAIDDLWDEDIHFIPPFAIPKTWYVDRSFDWGSSAPFSIGWWAEADGSEVRIWDKRENRYNLVTFPKGTLFRIAEWYGWNGEANKGLKMVSSEIARRIKKAEANLPYYVNPGPADTSIFSIIDGTSYADEMARVGVMWTRAAKGPGSRVIGLENLRDKLEASLVRPMESPGIFIFENCRQWRRTVPTLPRDQKKMDEVDTDAEDHCFDDTMYRLSVKKHEGKMARIIGI
jgi:hypothetical protein